MSLTSLKLFKQHVRADDFADDDEYLQQCLDAAEDMVVRATHRTADELKAMNTADATRLPAPITQAVLLVGGSLYDHREDDAPGTYSEIPIGASTIIKQYRRLCEQDQ